MLRAPFLIVLLLATLGSATANAATFNVTLFAQDAIDNNLGDCQCTSPIGGACTLRAAVMEANACHGTDTIHFANSALDQTIVLNLAGNGGAESGDLDISESLNIRGWWSGAVVPPEDADRLPIIDASALGSRIFQITGAGVSVDMRGLQLRGGQAPPGNLGGAIYNDAALTINTVRFDGNQASNAGAIANLGSGVLSITGADFVRNQASNDSQGGAAIVNFNQATIRRSSFRDNRHSGLVRAMVYTGPSSTLVVEDSIFSGAPEAAGENATNGIRAVDPDVLHLRNSTLVDLTQGHAALWLQALNGDGSIRVANSVLSNDSGQIACLLETVAGDAGDVLFDHSLIRQGAAANLLPCEPYFSPAVVDGPAPSLAAFTQNARQLTRYRTALLASGLRDAGNPDALDADPALRCTSSSQNGVLRPQDGDADGVARCDLGAAEASATSAITFVVDSTLDAPDSVPGDGVCATISATCTLRAAVMEANAKPGPDRIEFAPQITLAQLFLAGPGGAEFGDLLITEQLSIAGNLENGRPATTVLGLPGLQDRLFRISLPPGETVRIENLVLSGGRAADFQRGGALLLASANTLTLERVVLHHNEAGISGQGGALAATAGELILREADLHRNRAGDQGWAIYAGADARLVLENASIRLHGSGAGMTSDLKAAVHLASAVADISRVSFAGNETAVGGTGGFDLSLRHSSFMLEEDLLGEHFVYGVAHHLRLDGTADAKFQAIANAFEDGAPCEVQLAAGALQDSNHYNLSEAGCAVALGLGTNIVQPARLHYRSAPVEGRVARIVLPRPGSPLIDRVPADALHCPATDQRGAPRPVNASGQIAALCDVGAVEVSLSEYLPRHLTVNVTDVDLTDAATCNGYCDTDESSPGEQCTLRAAVMESNCAWLQQDWTSEIRIPQSGVTIPLDLPTAANGAGGTLFFGQPGYARRIIGPEVEGDARPLLIALHGEGLLRNTGNGSSLELANLRMSGGNEIPGLGGAVSHSSGGAIGPLYLRNMELFGNQATQGGALYSGAETLLERVSLHGNSALEFGSAISKGAGDPLTIVDSSIHGNTVVNAGERSAIRYHDSASSSLSISNTTISGNNGDGLSLYQALSDGNVYTVESSTIVNNAGHGVAFTGPVISVSERTLVLRHNVLHGNALGGCFAGGWNGSFDSVGYNLSQDSECAMAGGSNLIGVPALLGPLQTTLAPTAFHAPLAGSPLIDGGSPDAAACPDTDQLGNARPQDGNGDGIARCNIGAIESDSVPVITPPPSADSIFGSGFED